MISRQASVCCGVSLMVEENDIPTIENVVKEKEIEILKIAAVERDVNPRRDRYC